MKLLITHIGDTVDFLDITVSKDSRFQLSQLADISLYQKPMNKYLYLPQTSNHKKAVFKCTVKAEIRRGRINNTSDIKFNQFVDALHTRLKARGYTASYLDEHTDRSISRTTLLEQITIKNRESTPAPTIFKIHNTPRTDHININKCIQLTEDIWNDPDSHIVFPDRKAPIICYQRTKNLKENLIHSTYKYQLTSETQHL